MPKNKPLYLLPPLVFAGFAALAMFGLNRDNPNELPSQFAGKPAPDLTVVALRDDPAPTSDDLRDGEAKLVNFWASWCGPCRAEHPMLEDLAENGVKTVGINYKDQPQNAQRFLRELGDPFAWIGADDTGRTGINWGIYGVPETFVVDGEGNVILRHPGPLTPSIVEEKILPALNGG